MFITFEGGEGSGKTTQSKLLQEYLESLGFEVVWTRQPGGTEYGKRIREVVMNETGTEEKEIMPPIAEVLLYMADRNIHVENIIRPALESGKVVICDRYIDSSVAYQGEGRSIGIDKIEELNNFATDGLLPDLTIYIDVDVEIGIQRARSGDKKLDRIEQASFDFHKEVRRAYHKIAQKNYNRFVMVEPIEGVENMFKVVQKIVEEKFDLK